MNSTATFWRIQNMSSNLMLRFLWKLRCNLTLSHSLFQKYFPSNSYSASKHHSCTIPSFSILVGIQCTWHPIHVFFVILSFSIPAPGPKWCSKKNATNTRGYRWIYTHLGRLPLGAPRPRRATPARSRPATAAGAARPGLPGSTPPARHAPWRARTYRAASPPRAPPTTPPPKKLPSPSPSPASAAAAPRRHPCRSSPCGSLSVQLPTRAAARCAHSSSFSMGAGKLLLLDREVKQVRPSSAWEAGSKQRKLHD